MKSVRKFQTEDGQLFDNQPEARAHEAKLKAAKAIRAEYDAIFKTGRVDSLLTVMLEEPKVIRDILSSLIRSLPTTPASATVEFSKAA